LPYQNVSAVVDAFTAMPGERLVVVGQGPDHARLTRAAPPNVTFLGGIDDSELRWLYASCAGLVSASCEDYGLTPLEAASFGKPVAVLRGGGYLETVVEEETGVFFDAPSPVQVATALRRMNARTWSADVIRGHAATYNEVNFIRRLREVVAEEASVAKACV
jgi:glycosyltransferase involved in cell wall biosynthesis